MNTVILKVCFAGKCRFYPRRPWIVLLVCCSMMLCSQVRVSSADEVDPPEAEAVIEAYIEATGGMEAYEKISNRVLENVMELPGQGIKIKSVVKAAKPNLFRATTESDMLGNSDKGFDGEVVWENSTMTGPVIKEGKERDSFMMISFFDRVTYWKKAFAKAECTGSENVKDRPCYKLVMTPKEPCGTGESKTVAKEKSGDEEKEDDALKPMIWYFDRETKLLVRIDMTLAGPMGEMTFESHLGDYRDVDGILLPFETTLKMMGQEMKTVTTSIKHNVELPEDTFALPEDIALLLEDEA